MIEHSEKLDQLAAALAKAQASVKGAKKDASNPFFKTTYADLASVWDACREALTSNGLSVVQFPGFDNGIATLSTMLLHSSGQWLSATAGAPLAKMDAQGVGSALTYLRRYTLAAVASVSPEDDDGQAASGVKRKMERGGVSTASPKGVAVAPPSQPAPTTPSWKGKPLKDFTTPDLLTLRDFCEKKDPVKYKDVLDAIPEILVLREGE